MAAMDKYTVWADAQLADIAQSRYGGFDGGCSCYSTPSREHRK